jgi:antirestriction protein ArdC
MTNNKKEMLDNYKKKVNEHLLSVASKVIDTLEKEMKTKNIEPWETSVVSTQYHNPESHTEYNFENSALLYMSCVINGYKDKRFVTAKQAFSNGMGMEKGTTGHQIVQRFAMPIYPVFKKSPSGEIIHDNKGKPIPERDSDGKVKYIYKRSEKLATVFNVEQLKGDIPEKWNKKIFQKSELANEEQLQSFIQLLESTSPSAIKRHNIAENYYMPKQDTIYISTSDMFRNSLRELNTIFHEISHSTGHESRLNRDSLYNYSEERGYEELVANFCARALGMNYNISTEEQVEEFHRNHNAYDSSWCKSAMRKDPMAIFKAMQDAERAYRNVVKFINPELKKYPSLQEYDNANINKVLLKKTQAEQYEKRPKTKKKPRSKKNAK